MVRRRRSRVRLGKEVPQGCRGGVCHLDVVFSEVWEREGLVGEGNGDRVVRRLSCGGLSPGGVEEFASILVHDGNYMLRGDSLRRHT